MHTQYTHIHTDVLCSVSISSRSSELRRVPCWEGNSESQRLRLCQESQSSCHLPSDSYDGVRVTCVHSIMCTDCMYSTYVRTYSTYVHTYTIYVRTCGCAYISLLLGICFSSLLQISCLPKHNHLLPCWQTSLQNCVKEHHLQQQISLSHCHLRRQATHEEGRHRSLYSQSCTVCTYIRMYSM